MIEALNQMMCFAAVCEAGSMTAAAKILGCSKGHISRSLTAMEQRIKTTLFHRTTRKLTLTDAGLALRDEALQLYKNALFVEKKSLSLNQQLSGKFVITAPISLATFLLAPLLTDLQKAFPDVEFQIVPTNDSLNLIDEGIDMAIRTGSVVDESLIAHQVGLARDIFYANKNFIDPLPQKPSDLHGHQLIIHHDALDDQVLTLYKGAQTTELQPQNTMKVDLYTLIYDLVKQGAGIGFAPDYCLSKIAQDEHIEAILQRWHGKQWPIYIIYPFHVPLPQKLAKISAYLKNKLQLQFSAAK